ncbi:hypothetical protein HanRHA438_Chr10g0461871 [Helianthus annuus]|nr:hypothetical protein HanRHA438_Chr10g0461871 [Helianthus annuus]
MHCNYHTRSRYIHSIPFSTRVHVPRPCHHHVGEQNSPISTVFRRHIHYSQCMFSPLLVVGGCGGSFCV